MFSPIYVPVDYNPCAEGSFNGYNSNVNPQDGYKWYQSCLSSDMASTGSVTIAPCYFTSQSPIPPQQVSNPNLFSHEYEPPPTDLSMLYTSELPAYNMFDTSTYSEYVLADENYNTTIASTYKLTCHNTLSTGQIYYSIESENSITTPCSTIPLMSSDKHECNEELKNNEDDVVFGDEKVSGDVVIVASALGARFDKMEGVSAGESASIDALNFSFPQSPDKFIETTDRILLSMEEIKQLLLEMYPSSKRREVISLTSIPPDEQKIFGGDDDNLVVGDSDLDSITDKLELISINDEEKIEPDLGNSGGMDMELEPYQNTIAKGSSASVCAKISRQAGIFYEEAVAALNAAPLNQHFKKNWHSHVQLKAALFNAEACYRYGLELHEKEEIGEEIARLKSGIKAFSEAKKSSSQGAAQQLLDAYNILETNLTRNLERAVKENDRFYLMRVPPASSLQPLPALQMVKPMPVTEVLDAPGGQVYAFAVGNDFLFAGTQVGTILAWQYKVPTNSFEPAASFNGHALAVITLVVGANRIYSGSMDNSVRVCVLIFVGTNGETYFNTAALVSCVQNFPKSRGPVVGILKGFAGLSGAILSQIYILINSPDSASLIFMVAVGPAMVVISLMFIVRPVGGHRQVRSSDGASSSFIYCVCLILAACLMGGYFSEIIVKDYAYPRHLAMAIAQFTMAFGHLFMAMGWPGEMYVGTLVIGLGYGAHCVIVPAAASELFGLKKFGALYNFLTLANPAGTLIFSSLLASSQYDSESVTQAQGLPITLNEHSSVVISVLCWDQFLLSGSLDKKSDSTTRKNWQTFDPGGCIILTSLRTRMF